MNNEQVPPQPNSIDLTLIAACLFVIATILLAVALSYTRTIMIPFILALFLSYFIYPLVELLKKHAKFPHWLAVLSSLSCFGLFIIAFVLVVRGSVMKLMDSFYFYEEK
ncbi:hypothetical protein COU75_00200, partial [Candidatus Peregrinibacteria bacterium CG10_big_fil_rev_8_21_14_0_10_42_8]